MNSVIVGDLSGLQSFLFAVPQGEGEQAKRLRARSFYIQTLAECCALKFLVALDWGRDRLVFCGAAKFVISAPETADPKSLRDAALVINEWLLTHLGGQLSFSWSLASGDDSESVLWNRAISGLQPEKLRPWGQVCQSADRWLPNKMVLDKVDPYSNNQPRVPAPNIFPDEVVGRALPRAKWLEVSPAARDADFNVLGFGCTLHASDPAYAPESLALYSLTGQERLHGRPVERRHLARYIPTDPQGAPLLFERIADRPIGDKLLAVLKMDVDSLGLAFERLQRVPTGLHAVPELSRGLDSFFSEKLDREVRSDARWQLLYTLFSGGDDLLVLGPWDTAFDYAAHVQRLFSTEFARESLTISAGLAIVKPKFPIQRAAQMAEELLRQAKGEGKDRFAALGQVWRWQDHAAIARAATDLVGWVQRRAAQRGWLQELLQFAEAAAVSGPTRTDVSGLSPEALRDRARANLLANARLSYQVARKYPGAESKNPDKASLRRWIDHVNADLDRRTQPTTRYLPAITRYAIAATRSPKP